MMKNRYRSLGLCLVALLLSPWSLAKTVEVTIYKYKFTPQEITVAPGDTIRWVNKEKRQYHSVWFKESGEEEPQYFFPDETYEKSFSDVGEFNYICGPHPEMTGKVFVKAGE